MPYVFAARTVVHLIVGPARDERCVVLSLSCGASLRRGVRSASALCGCLLRGGKTVTRRLTPKQLAAWQPLFDNARKMRSLLAELQELTLQAIGAGDQDNT